MSESSIVVLALLVLVWAVLSGRLARSDVTGPFLFVVVGVVGAWAGADWAAIDLEASTVHQIAEVTLALVLFADASRLDVAGLREDLGTPARLLLVALPLTILAGYALGSVLFGALPAVLVWLLAASLAPTDAALSATLIADERVPARIRRALNVESGLNDGIATPVVTVCIAIAASEAVGLDPASDIPAALREVALGAGVGLAVGVVGAAAVEAADRRDWILPGGRRLAILAMAVLAFSAAGALDGNVFIAAFVGGLGFAVVAHTPRVREATQLTELSGELAALVVWFIVGASLVRPALEDLTAARVAYAAGSLTVVRMVPVAVAMAGRWDGLPSVAFLGWFGPRGLASVVFALLTVEGLDAADPQVELVTDVITLTVLASVVLHGLTAQPLAGRFGAWCDRRAPGPTPPAPAMRQRRPHRHLPGPWHEDGGGPGAGGHAQDGPSDLGVGGASPD